MFDSALLALGDILFLSGLTMTIGKLIRFLQFSFQNVLSHVTNEYHSMHKIQKEFLERFDFSRGENAFEVLSRFLAVYSSS